MIPAPFPAQVDFGIAGMGAGLGEQVDLAATVADQVDDPERVLRWGYRSYHRAADGVSATDLAVAAGRQALDRAGCLPEQLDLVVLAVADVPEYLHWDASAALAAALGAHGTPTLLLTQGCASGLTAFGQVAGAMALRPCLKNVLLVAVGRLDEAYRNRMRINTCLFSDGASAVLLRRGHPRLRWLATEQLTDGAYSDFFRVPHRALGTSTDPGDGNTLPRIQQHFQRDPRRLTRFVDQITSRVGQVIDQACASVGAQRREISRLLYLHENQQTFAELSRALDIPLDRTNAEPASRFGHVAGADQLLCLDELVERGELMPGELVAMAGISMGMHWFCTLVQV